MIMNGAKRKSVLTWQLLDFDGFYIILAAIVVVMATGLTYEVVVLGNSQYVKNSKNPLPFLVAICSLMGTGLTAVISVIGLALKRSIDSRTSLLQQEAENRLRTESAMKAIEMMTATGLDPAAVKDRRQGAIVALTSMGQIEFALSIMEEYVNQGTLSIRFAVRIIDQAFRGHEIGAKFIAASLLYDLSQRLSDNEGGYYFPESTHLKWNMSIPLEARRWVLDAQIKCMLSKQKNEWKPSTLNQFAYTLYKALITDDDDSVRYFSAAILKTLCSLPDKIGIAFMPPDRQSIGYLEMEAEYKKLGDVHDRQILSGKIVKDCWDYHMKTKEWAAKS